IVVTTTFTENAPGATQEVSTAKLTSVQVELTAVYEAPANVCSNRHVYGVGEMVNVSRIPASFQVSLDICGDSSLIGADDDVFWCPWGAGSYNLKVAGGGAEHKSSVSVLAPIPTVVNAYWNGVTGTVGTAGNMSMIIELEVCPKTVSFLGIYMEEIPDESNNCGREGYFADPTNGPPWSHSFAAGAGRWSQIKSQGRWCADGVGTDRMIQPPWSSGWKVWSIPVGWGDGLLQLRGQVLPAPTTQRFEIDGNGVMSIRKYGHEIIRAPDNRVWVDGVQRN
ncbi:MAG: hypothetical protein IKJ45_12285, partial [Kiritimatiellae bacterium]|nr:hypothetical protein [Kiritimatiellia bacterium]